METKTKNPYRISVAETLAMHGSIMLVILTLQVL